MGGHPKARYPEFNVYSMVPRSNMMFSAVGFLDLVSGPVLRCDANYSTAPLLTGCGDSYLSWLMHSAAKLMWGWSGVLISRVSGQGPAGALSAHI